MNRDRFILVTALADWDWLSRMQRPIREAYKASLEQGRYPQLIQYPEEFFLRSGYLILLDHTRQEVLGVKPMPLPTGCVVENRRIIVGSWASQDVCVLEGDGITSRISWRYFNNIHSIKPVGTTDDAKDGRTSASYLLAVKGTECIVDMNLEGEVLWSWFAHEHGFNTTPCGHKITFDKALDWRKFATSTVAQATHLNSAVQLDEGSVVASFPILGRLVRIDRRSGRAEVVLGDLKFPHALRRCRDGFTVCNTRDRSVLVLDDHFRIRERIHVDAPWLMDCYRADDGSTFVISNTDWPSPGDCDMGRLFEFDADAQVKTIVTWGGDIRLSEVHEVTGAQAEYWASAWSGEREALRDIRSRLSWWSAEGQADCRMSA